MGTGALSQPAEQARLTIGLVAALPAEIRSLTVAPARFYTPQLLNPHVFGIISGIGEKNANHAVGMLLQQGVRALVSWGTAGALHPALKSGDLILPGAVFTSDRSLLSTDAEWIGRIQQCLLSEAFTVHGGGLAESGTVLSSARSKAGLGSETGAVAVDMETGAILRAALAHGLPCIAIRAIVDECHDVVPQEILNHTDDYGRPGVFSIIAELALKPGLLRPLIRLSRAMHAATATLNIVARRAGATLMYPV